jgi:hypothetical protein
MSKRTLFTTVTALPPGITRETVLETLHNHVEMIDLNPLVMERHLIKAPKEATAEEFHCAWYQITDKVNYLPGGLYSGTVTFKGCFHDLPNGLQTHIYAPAGLNMKGRWTLGGSLPGEPREAVELGANIPKTGLWLKEDVDMRCNFVMSSFVRGTTKKAHGTLVNRLVEKAHIVENRLHNDTLAEQVSLRNSYPPHYRSSITSPTQYMAGQQMAMQGSPPHSPPLGGSFGGTPPSVGSPGSMYQGPDHSYFNPTAYGDPRAAYPAPLNVKSGKSYTNIDPNYQKPTHFMAELPSDQRPSPTELDSSRRPF